MIPRLIIAAGLIGLAVASSAAAQVDPIRITLPVGGEVLVDCAAGQAEAHTAGGDVTVHCHDAGGAPTATTAPIATATRTRTPTPPAGATLTPATGGGLRAFGTVQVSPDLVLNGAGSNIDDPAFYEDGTNTLLFVTGKANDVIEVWRYPFSAESPVLTPGGDVNGVDVDQVARRLYATAGGQIAAYSLPGLARLGTMDPGAGLGSEPGVGVLHSPGVTYVMAADGGDNIFLMDASTGTRVRTISTDAGTEGIVGDDFYQAIYAGDENGRSGMYAYSPGGGPFNRNGTNHWASGVFQSDAEGAIIWACPVDGSSDDGRGLIVVSDQRDPLTDFEVWDRQTWAHLGVIHITGVNNTDGIASTQRPLPGFPLGILAVVDDDTTTALVGWDDILAATGISCDGAPVPTAAAGSPTSAAPSATAPGAASPTIAVATATHDHNAPTATALPAGAQMPQLVDWGAWDVRRIPISLEAWWTQASLTPGQPTSQTADFGHVHAEARLPLGQDVSGVLNFDVRIVLHNNPGTLERLRFDDDGGVRLRIPLNHTCPSGTCSFNVPVSLDTRSMSNGWRELRMRAEVDTPDGKAFLNSGGIPLHVVNGSGGSDYDRWCGNKSLIARGWYDGFGYTNPVIECVPQAPVSGVWRPRFYAQEGNGGRVIIAVDRAHAVPAVGPHPAIPQSAGWTLFDAASISRFQEIPIDTTRLVNGWHTLSMIVINSSGGRSSCNLPGLCQGGINHPAGVARLWFMVQN